MHLGPHDLGLSGLLATRGAGGGGRRFALAGNGAGARFVWCVTNACMDFIRCHGREFVPLGFLTFCAFSPTDAAGHPSPPRGIYLEG